MIEPLPHKREDDRSRELHSLNILDTFAEQEYDDLTMLATQICDVPVALISFIDDDRQWFKSKVGLEVAETPRSVSFCGHAINEEIDHLIVEDARLDPRFADNPIVCDHPNVVFYTGVKLMMNELPLGTLCVIDHEPKKLNDEQIKSLRALGRQVERLLELRVSKREIQTALDERNLLFSELKHRTKNNLQLIASLIGIKARKSPDPDRFNDIINMIIAMSRVYERSYEGEARGSVPIHKYVEDVIGLFDSDPNISFNLKIDAGSLTEREALYTGLILNEAITNAKKHAISGEALNMIIEYNNRGDARSFVISDNGPGFPVDIDKDDSYPHGISLMRSMAEQIDGEITFSSEGGAKINLLMK
ncbi:MAG: histidine kinase dimerization/phosphoacceptor domain -containing protein [Crocinitomicaceae bacterium]